MQERMKQYRETLLKSGFFEPIYQKKRDRCWLFYKPETNLTVFVVNLNGVDDRVEVIYGYASTAFTLIRGDEESLIKWGVSNTDINLREKAVIRNDVDEEGAMASIQKLYNKYRQIEKDELLEITKRKRKKFIDMIAVRLKKLGLKKKATTWKKSLEDEFYLMFEVQKSSFSDEYYFNVYIGKEHTDFSGDCHYSRVYPANQCPLDWQIISESGIMKFLENEVVPLLVHVMNTPLYELGNEEYFSGHCECDRKQCNCCWIQKTGGIQYEL